ncbi:hypothetical protein [Nonomuraea sp. NPDC049709]|uniref:hypothetical protein n=1 Tax=Nonomuraea sp. NPDC049709 TaxID=3154736 RepID=UPI003436E090
MKDDDPAALMTALTTEHFVLQTAASTATSEESSRATLYVMALSSSLVAMGFTAQTSAFTPLAATVLPVVFVLGLFTTVRLVDTGLQNMHLRSAIARIRAYYRGLSPQAPRYILMWDDQADEAAEAMADLVPVPRHDRLVGLFTIASMVAAINSVVAGTGTALLVSVLGGAVPLAVALGLGAAALHFGLFYAYQRRRYRIRLERWNHLTRPREPDTTG